MQRELNDRELATVLAALRYYQHHGMAYPGSRPYWLQVIACPTEGKSLDDNAIDALCERLNCGPVATTPNTRQDPQDPPVEVHVPVEFEGVVTVNAPARLSAADRRKFAEKLALARIVATVDDPDAPEGEAFDEYQEEGGQGAGEEWDNAELSVAGEWNLTRASGDKPMPNANTPKVTYEVLGYASEEDFEKGRWVDLEDAMLTKEAALEFAKSYLGPHAYPIVEVRSSDRRRSRFCGATRRSVQADRTSATSRSRLQRPASTSPSSSRASSR